MALSAKGAMRRVMRVRLGAMALEDRRAASERVARQLEHLLCEGLVLGYAALADEVDLKQVWSALAESDRLVLPRVVEEGLALHRVTELSSLRPGAHGIMEPTDPRAVRPEELDVVVVPGRAFDASGGRLGRGGGYYDRLFVSAPNAVKIGVCFACQAVEVVPMEAHDVRMDRCVTERGLLA